MRSASHPHAFLGVSESGLAAIVRTKGSLPPFPSRVRSVLMHFHKGNRDLHVILRGGSRGTNYDSESVKAAASAVGKISTPEMPFIAAVMVDASHANSSKDHNNQPKVRPLSFLSLSARNTKLTHPANLGHRERVRAAYRGRERYHGSYD